MKKPGSDSIGKAIYPGKLEEFLGSGFLSYEQLLRVSRSDERSVDITIKLMVANNKLEPWVATECITCKHVAPAARNLDDIGPEVECLLCGEITPVEFLDFHRFFKILKG
jgi:hypothetical protein